MTHMTRGTTTIHRTGARHVDDSLREQSRAAPETTTGRSSDPIDARVAQERARLYGEANIECTAARQFRRPPEFRFTRAQRCETTLLFGGLTRRHECLIQAAWEGLGYRCEIIPTPDVGAFQLGKEFGNNGLCNPAYFTVGNLIQYLQRKRDDEGLTVEEIKDRYVFLTAGACGPCRFGMYESEYRLALRNAGFDGFRVIVFQQSAGLSQTEEDAGLEMNLDFFLGMLTAMILGDLIGALGAQLRPYEMEQGATDRAVEESLAHVARVLRERPAWRLPANRLTRLAGRLVGGEERLDTCGKYIARLRDTRQVAALAWVRERFDRLAVDRLRAKPVVKITGEFWAQTTEGDGNFNMFRFLEREGAQVLGESIATWIAYMLHQAKQRIRDRRGLVTGGARSPWRRLRDRLRAEADFAGREFRLSLAERLFRREFERYRLALGGTCHPMPDQYGLQRLAHPYFNSRAGGGEGHLEVAKTIHDTTTGLCHMVLGLKPFGCMPSTQSDGTQAAVVQHYKEIIYLPIETSGEGEVNAHSRVQMALGEARRRARDEFAAVVAASGYTLEEIRAGLASQPEAQRPLTRLPHLPGVVGTAARYVGLVTARMRARGIRPGQVAR